MGLLLEIAARKALASYLVHQRWGLGLGSPNPSDGNQVLSTHNKNPLTHFDLDTIYDAKTLREKGMKDAESKIQRHIVREIGWLATELSLLADDLLLTASESLTAISLFYHVLLADTLAGASRPPEPPKELMPAAAIIIAR